MVTKAIKWEELVSGLGKEKALWLLKTYGSKTLPALRPILMKLRDEAVFADWLKGKSPGELCGLYKLTRRQCDKILETMRAAERRRRRETERVKGGVQSVTAVT